MNETEKKTTTVITLKNVVIQFIIIVFYTIVWLNVPLFGGNLNVAYFLFMFIAAVIGAIITLYSKASPNKPILKKPTQQYTNLAKAMTDIISNFIGKQPPQVKEIKDIVQKALIWSIREALISPEFDRQTLEEAEEYIFSKLFPKKEIGEEESPSTG